MRETEISKRILEIAAEMQQVKAAARATSTAIFEETFEVARAAGRHLGIEVTGTPHCDVESFCGTPQTRKPVRAYFVCVSKKRSEFETRRHKAWEGLRQAGEWPMTAEYLGECWKGYSALGKLYIAGMLYAMRIEAVIDTRSAQSTLRGSFV